MQASLSRTEHTIDRVDCQLLGRSHLNCFRASLSQLGAADQRTHAHLPFFNSDCKLIFVLLTLPLVLGARIHRYVPSTRGNRGPEVCVDHRRLSVDPISRLTLYTLQRTILLSPRPRYAVA